MGYLRGTLEKYFSEGVELYLFVIFQEMVKIFRSETYQHCFSIKVKLLINR